MKTTLPRTCIPVSRIEQDSYDWEERHAAKLREVRTQKFPLVFIGDSITHFWSGESGPDLGQGSWKEFFGNIPALNLGYGFDRTQNVLWRIDHGELENQDPKLFVINIGTNQFSITANYDGDTPEDAFAGIRAVLTRLHEKFPASVLLDMAIFPRGGKKELIEGTNALLRNYVPTLPYADFLDLSDLLGTPGAHDPIPEYYQPDLCHLSRPGYRIWKENLNRYLEKYL